MIFTRRQLETSRAQGSREAFGVRLLVAVRKNRRVRAGCAPANEDCPRADEGKVRMNPDASFQFHLAPQAMTVKFRLRFHPPVGGFSFLTTKPINL